MGWLVEIVNESTSVCPKSACFNLDACNCYGDCAKNTGFCAIKVYGPDCLKRSCGVYFT